MRSARVLLGSAVLATAALTMAAPAAFAAGENGTSSSSSDSRSSSSVSVDGGNRSSVVTVPACNAVSSSGTSVFTCLPGATAVF